MPNRSFTDCISIDTIAKIAERFFQSPFALDKIQFLWHVGEPLSLPPDFYEEAFSIIEKSNLKNLKVTHIFQTNGTLVTQKWCNFLVKNKINVGVSLDGPQWIHDMNRLDRSGKGTFDRVMRGIRLLQENDIHISVIMVLTSIALVSATEIWNFFVEHDLHDIAFNPEEVKGVNVASTIHAQNFIEAYQSFLETIADLREKSGLNIKVRELDTFMARIKYGSGEIYSTLNNPFSILNFDYNGNFSTYCPELLTAQNSRFGNFILGNVHHHSLESILQSKKFHAIYQEIESGKQQCLSECEFFEVCGGGNPSNKMSENNSFDSSETMNCQFTIQSNCRAVLSFLERQMQIA